MSCNGCKPLEYGDLKYRGMFEKPKQESDGRGGWKKEAYTEYKKAWMGLKATPRQLDRERVESQQLVAGMTYVVKVRYRRDITADMRIIVDSRTLYIIKNPYDPDGRRVWTLIECEERRT